MFGRDQGEDNTHYCTTRQYNCLWASMMADWRQRFRRTSANLPIVAVQLGGYADKGNVSIIRFAQTDALPQDESYFISHLDRIPVANSAVAATYDLLSPNFEGPQQPTLSPWIHCRNKSEVGRRVAIALNALQAAPNTPQEPSTMGPLVQAAKVQLDSGGLPFVVLNMKEGAGLALLPVQRCIICCAQAPNGINATYSPFQVSNRAGKWLPAVGEVNPGSTLTVRPVATVKGSWVTAVRYNVIDVPQCALYNEDGIPAFPFQLPLPWSSP